MNRSSESQPGPRFTPCSKPSRVRMRVRIRSSSLGPPSHTSPVGTRLSNTVPSGAPSPMRACTRCHPGGVRSDPAIPPTPALAVDTGNSSVTWARSTNAKRCRSTSTTIKRCGSSLEGAKGRCNAPSARSSRSGVPGADGMEPTVPQRAPEEPTSPQRRAGRSGDPARSHAWTRDHCSLGGALGHRTQRNDLA